MSTEQTPAPLRTTDGPDYAVVLNGEPLTESDAGGTEDEGYVVCGGYLDGEYVDVWVSYGRDGMQEVSIRPVAREDDEMRTIGLAADQPDDGLRFVDEVIGHDVEVRILPATEVDDGE